MVFDVGSAFAVGKMGLCWCEVGVDCGVSVGVEVVEDVVKGKSSMKCV